MKKNFFQKNLPHFIAVLLFLGISFTYFSAVFENKELVGHDTESWVGMYQGNKIYNETYDDTALWSSSMFSGMPSYQIGYKSKMTVLSLINKILNLFPRPVFTLFLYLIGFYILLILFGLSPWLSVAGAIAFAFGSYNFIILAVGHNTKAIAIAYMAPLIGSIIFAFRRNRWIGAVLTSLFLGLAIYANHLQILYYTLILLIVYGISELIYSAIEKKLKDVFATFGLLVIAAVVALGMNATILMVTKEYSEYTMRGKSNGLSETIDKDSHQVGLSKDYITNWSYGIDETMTLLIPNYKGGASQEKLSVLSNTAKKLREAGVPNVEQVMSEMPFPTYWGAQPGTSGPVYVGAILCFLFVLGLFLVEGKNKWWLLAGTILSILLAWGKNFMPFTDFFIDYVPLYNMFRAVSMTLVMTSFCVALLGALALKQLFDSNVNVEKKKKALLASGAIIGGVCLLFAIFPGIAGNFEASIDNSLARYGYPDFVAETLPLDRMAMLRSDAFRSFVFIALAFVCLYIYISGKIKTLYASIALAVLFLADMTPIAKRYLNNEHFSDKKIGSYFAASPADKYLLQDRSTYRMLDLTVDVFNSSKPSYFHNCIGGYHAAKLRRYQELINMHLNREIFNIQSSFESARLAQSIEPVRDNLATCQVLNMLNMKYLIYNHNAEPIVNPFANGTAWFVDTCFVVQTPDEEMLMLGSINTKKELVVDKKYGSFIPERIVSDSLSKIDLLEYSPNRVKYKSTAASNQIAVFSEVYYDKGWNAYVDGEQVPHFRANYLLRALPVKAGEHEIEFRFEPDSFRTGNIIMLISTILFILFLAVVCFFEYKKRKMQNE